MMEKRSQKPILCEFKANVNGRFHSNSVHGAILTRVIFIQRFEKLCSFSMKSTHWGGSKGHADSRIFGKWKTDYRFYGKLNSIMKMVFLKLLTQSMPVGRGSWRGKHSSIQDLIAFSTRRFSMAYHFYFQAYDKQYSESLKLLNDYPHVFLLN